MENNRACIIWIWVIRHCEGNYGVFAELVHNAELFQSGLDKTFQIYNDLNFEVFFFFFFISQCILIT